MIDSEFDECLRIWMQETEGGNEGVEVMEVEVSDARENDGEGVLVEEGEVEEEGVNDEERTNVRVVVNWHPNGNLWSLVEDAQERLRLGLPLCAEMQDGSVQQCIVAVDVEMVGMWEFDGEMGSETESNGNAEDVVEDAMSFIAYMLSDRRNEENESLNEDDQSTWGSENEESGNNVFDLSFVEAGITSEVEVIDLTHDDVPGDVPVPATVSSLDGYGEDVVWGGDAGVSDVMAIRNMLAEGVGVFGHPNCKLELGDSLLEGAGRGVFLKAGCVINHGECITQYSGKNVKNAKRLNVEEQLRSIEVNGADGRPLIVLGERNLKEGDGFGSFLNSTVDGRTYSFCRFVRHENGVYAIAHLRKKQYPLRGYIELYLTAGQAWWSLFNSLDK